MEEAADGRVVSARGLVRRFGRGSGTRAVVDGVDLDVQAGTLTAVVGPSGGGKSTLLHLLGGLDRPTEGRVELLGRDLARVGEGELARLRRRSVGYVFQFFHLVPELTAWENALLPARLAGDVPAGRVRLTELFGRLALDGRGGQLPLDLSGGEQQRVAIARALVMEPHLLLADEPTGNLDEATGHEVLALLRAAVTPERAIVMVTHNPEHAAAADVLHELRDGRLVR